MSTDLAHDLAGDRAIDPALLRRLQERFDHFARLEVPDDPLYRAIAEAVAARPAWAALLAAAPATQQLPVLWFAALHDRLLERCAAGARPGLADYYPSAGPARAPDAAFAGHLADFLAREHAALRERIASRSTQTNEIGRCAVLWPLLRAECERRGRTRVALLDVGTSAGLNLGVDHWRYRYVDDAAGATLAIAPPAAADDVPEIACRVLAGAPMPMRGDGPAPEIVERLGIDVAPVDVADEAAVRWLRACVWPHDATRGARFEAAVRHARARRWPVRACDDAIAAAESWLEALPADVLPVVFNSWVLAYFEPAARQAYAQRLLAAVAARDAAWISGEPPGVGRSWWPALPEPAPPAPGGAVDAAELAHATAWTIATAAPAGGIAWRLGARSHAHGRWVRWGG
ncbi:MAG: DUF2332 family protein [Burkholderiaceae bacterium]